jgi:hypothetical protein
MHKNILIALTVFFCQCKKEYTCDCVISDVNNRASYTDQQTFSKKLTKKQATAACSEMEDSLQDNFSQNCYNCAPVAECKLK